MEPTLSSAPLCVGCVGGGQLGRMMALEAPRLNLSMKFLDPAGSEAPAAAVAAGSAKVIQGALNDLEKLKELSCNCDIVTVEIEHVGVNGLKEMEDSGVNVQPSSRVIGIIQDKFVQKEHFRSSGVPLPPFMKTPTMESIKEAASKLGLPLMLKRRLGAYDGRGNSILSESSDDAIHMALEKLGITNTTTNNTEDEFDLYAEGWIHFHSEVAVMVVRSTTGETRTYPAVTAVQTNSICRVVMVPAREVPPHVRKQCELVASKAVDSLGDGATGVFGVEMFVVPKKQQQPSSSSSSSLSLDDMTVLLNEVAPRPHNTGHYTQNACAVSQFENHLRAICGLPLGDTNLIVGAAAMVNILGATSGSMEDTSKSVNAALTIPRTTVHWYGKRDCRSGRKMGHINITADSNGEIDATLLTILKAEGVSSESVIPGGLFQSSPLVGVIMGSQSDLPTMQASIDMLKRFKIPYEVDIVSAHRTPDKLVSYSRSASGRGIHVIIAGAGGAAHLPGMVAAMTPLPVIGVPIKTSTLNGQDSLLSIVQMPRGVPVATVAIGNATNAGLLAVRMLCSSRPKLREQMEQYQLEMKEMVDDMSTKLSDLGSEKFIEGMDNKNKFVNV